ncbi:MAG: hypothetical protein IPJ88_04310 [Myxococcales bacterium]|nr:MAG: hypothetical protein IPJ88_04310 [Myxococcales bacterium]
MNKTIIIFMIVLGTHGLTACATTQSTVSPQRAESTSSEYDNTTELVKKGDVFASRAMYLRAEQYY